MYKFYTKQHVISDINNDVISIVYESKRPCKKDITKLEPFVKHNIVYVGLSPVQDYGLHELGIYLVYDDNANDKQWLYFVCPKRETCKDSDNSFLAANHYTFCYDKGDKTKPCHFHSTMYNCLFQQISNSLVYKCDHTNDFIPDKITIPIDESLILKKHSHVRKLIVKTMMYPYSQEHIGGTKRRKSKCLARDISNKEFCDLWYRRKIKSMKAFGIKQGDKYHWSIYVKDQSRIIQGRLYDAYYLITDIADKHEEKIQLYLASELQ